MRLFHFSENPGIAVFRPHAAPWVWAIDEDHSPSYWFPRDCPRACCWVGGAPITEAGAALLGSGARRLHVIEDGWLARIQACQLYAYEFDPTPFIPRVTDAGYWVTGEHVTPLSVTLVGDLRARHAAAHIELRIVKNLWPLIDSIVASGLEFSIIRKANAQPRLR